MKGKTNGSFSSNAEKSAFEFGLKLGELHHTIKEHIEAFAAQAGGAVTFNEVAAWVARLLSDSTDGSELVPEVRKMGVGTRLQKGSLVKSKTNLHVRPRNRRTLSAKARRAISLAQRARWSKWRAEQRAA